jgi:thiamine pyrophosphate-dependent acetolactate synthase large subunit-like protein
MATDNSTAAFVNTIEGGKINSVFGVLTGDYMFPFSLQVNGKPYEVYLLFTKTASAAALAADANYAALPNGSIAICMVSAAPLSAIKGGTWGLTDGTWA